MLAQVRRLSPVDRLAAAYVLAYLGGLSVRTPGTPTTVAVGTLAFFPLGLAVAWANWRNSRLEVLDARTRIGWLLLSLSALSLWTSGTAWATYIVFYPRETVRSRVPVVCMTGFAGGPGDAPGIGDGVVAVVSKPFSAEQLLQAVAADIGTHEPAGNAR